MRWLPLAVAVLGACADERGAVITLHGDAMTASRIEVVLASTNVKFVTQRTSEAVLPKSSPTAEVAYYVQESTTRSIADVGAIESFQIRIEPDPAAPDASYIPLVLVFDASSGREQLVGVGRIGDEPTAIQLPTGRIERYDVTIEATQALVAQCGDKVSGYAWQWADGEHRRLVVPLDPGELDATGKPLDLDCDAHDVESDGECDDLDGSYHADATELCPTDHDYDCDGRATTTKVCAYGGQTGDACVGVQACDAVGDPVDICIVDENVPTCACEHDRCHACVLEGTATSSGGDARNVCQPAIALLQHDLCTDAGGCEVEIIESPPGWDAGFVVNGAGTTKTQIARNTQVAFGVRAQTMQFPPQMAGTTFGRIVLTSKPLSGSGRKSTYFYRLELEKLLQPRPECEAAPPPFGTAAFKMNCDTPTATTP